MLNALNKVDDPLELLCRRAFEDVYPFLPGRDIQKTFDSPEQRAAFEDCYDLVATRVEGKDVLYAWDETKKGPNFRRKVALVRLTREEWDGYFPSDEPNKGTRRDPLRSLCLIEYLHLRYDHILLEVPDTYKGMNISHLEHVPKLIPDSPLAVQWQKWQRSVIDLLRTHPEMFADIPRNPNMTYYSDLEDLYRKMKESFRTNETVLTKELLVQVQRIFEEITKKEKWAKPLKEFEVSCRAILARNADQTEENNKILEAQHVWKTLYKRKMAIIPILIHQLRRYFSVRKNTLKQVGAILSHGSVFTAAIPTDSSWSTASLQPPVARDQFFLNKVTVKSQVEAAQTDVAELDPLDEAKLDKIRAQIAEIKARTNKTDRESDPAVDPQLDLLTALKAERLQVLVDAAKAKMARDEDEGRAKIARLEAENALAGAEGDIKLKNLEEMNQLKATSLETKNKFLQLKSELEETKAQMDMDIKDKLAKQSLENDARLAETRDLKAAKELEVRLASLNLGVSAKEEDMRLKEMEGLEKLNTIQVKRGLHQLREEEIIKQEALKAREIEADGEADRKIRADKAKVAMLLTQSESNARQNRTEATIKNNTEEAQQGREIDHDLFVAKLEHQMQMATITENATARLAEAREEKMLAPGMAREIVDIQEAFRLMFQTNLIFRDLIESQI
jgi:hypothetical protein